MSNMFQEHNLVAKLHRITREFTPGHAANIDGDDERLS